MTEGDRQHGAAGNQPGENGKQPGEGARQDSKASERNWMPVAIAAAVVVAALGLIVLANRTHAPDSIGANAQPDAYASKLEISKIEMSESANLAGGKMTYVDGVVTNAGGQTATAVTVEVIFRNAAHEVAQRELVPMMLIRTREPYIDTEPVAVMPLVPSGVAEFRLTFEKVTDEWDGVYPEVRVMRVTTR